jgi:transcriptional regulator with XRE-family HTH domain
MTKPIELSADEERKYRRLSLRSLFTSVLWCAFTHQKKTNGLTLTRLAEKTGRKQQQVSRWFSSNPNWTLDSIADVAEALNLELRIEAKDKSTGMIFTPYGIKQDDR